MALARMACLGAGRMGRGIAHSAIWSGHEIVLVDVKQRTPEEFSAAKEAALDEISGSIAMMMELGRYDQAAGSSLIDRVKVVPRTEAASALMDAELVFEAVPERLDAKKDAFALFDECTSDTAILASTTSTMLSTELSEFTKAPERFLNAHWLNPAFLVPLVEVSPSDKTSDETLEKTKAMLEAIGKLPVVCKASPGYMVPRIQALAMNEAARLVEEGVASAEDVDKAVKYGFGLRFAVLGLLEFIDWGGGDILYYASDYMSKAFNEDRFAAPNIVQQNMKSNRIGLKSGSGFFDYDNVDLDAYRKKRLEAFLKMVDDAGFAQPPKL